MEFQTCVFYFVVLETRACLGGSCNRHVMICQTIVTTSVGSCKKCEVSDILCVHNTVITAYHVAQLRSCLSRVSEGKLSRSYPKKYWLAVSD